MVPTFLASLLAVRGLPAILCQRTVGGRRIVVAALMQAASLPFVIAATTIGAELGVIGPAESAALFRRSDLGSGVFRNRALALAS